MPLPLLPLIMGGLSAGLGYLGSRSQNNPQPLQSPNPIWPAMQAPLGDWLYSMFYYPNGVNSPMALSGLPKYPGSLYPEIDNTVLQQVWSQLQAGNPAMEYLSQVMPSLGKTDEATSNDFFQVRNRGGIEGSAPYNNMNRLISGEHAGFAGGDAMQWLMNTGIASPAGQWAKNMAMWGIPGEAGFPLKDIAYGKGQSAKYLEPFLTMPANSRKSPVNYNRRGVTGGGTQ